MIARHDFRALLVLALALAAAPAAAELPTTLIEGLTNAPNPFDSRQAGLLGQTRIGYQLASDARVHVALYDLLGSKVQEWTFSPGESGGRLGSNEFHWDGTNAVGQKVSKGGYIAAFVIESPRGTAKTLRKIAVIH